MDAEFGTTNDIQKFKSLTNNMKWCSGNKVYHYTNSVSHPKKTFTLCQGEVSSIHHTHVLIIKITSADINVCRMSKITYQRS